MRNDRSVAIVGAGIHGLAAALVLTEAGDFGPITVYTREPVLATTSTVAGGLIEPAFVAADEPRIAGWFSASRARLQKMLPDPSWYICRRPVRTFWKKEAPPPSWAGLVEKFSSQPCSVSGAILPYEWEWFYTTEVVETPRHIAELFRRLGERGVRIIEREVDSLLALAQSAPIIINCTGVGARRLGDEAVTSASGQVVIVERSARIPDEVILADENLTYIIPRISDIVVGGTFGEGDYSREPQPRIAQDIMQRTTAFLPELREARILEHRVGLRPLRRPRPRLDVEVGQNGAVFAHCYGTGGAGITLAYGMAEDLVRQIRQAI